MQVGSLGMAHDNFTGEELLLEVLTIAHVENLVN